MHTISVSHVVSHVASHVASNVASNIQLDAWTYYHDDGQSNGRPEPLRDFWVLYCLLLNH